MAMLALLVTSSFLYWKPSCMFAGDGEGNVHALLHDLT